MQRRRIILIVTTTLVGSLLGANLQGSGSFMGQSMAQPKPQDEPKAAALGGHDPSIATRAGKDKNATVHLRPTQLDRLGVRVERLKAGNVRSILARPATLSFDLDRVAKIGPRLTSKVIRVTKDLGAVVKKGEAVAVMNSVELGQIQSRYLAAKARVATEQATYRREKNLYGQRISSETDMLEAQARYNEAEADLDAARDALRLYGVSPQAVEAAHKTGKHPLSFYSLTSPIDGVIQRRDLVPGETIEPSETPIEVVDPSRVWVLIEVYEHDIPKLTLGQSVELSLRSLPAHTFQGAVDWISQELDRETRTLRLRAVVENPDSLLRAGMFGIARINTGKVATTALVPVDAVQTLSEQSVVFVPGDEAGSFKPIAVLLGEESDGLAEIVSGVEPGEQVVTRGAFALKSALTAGSRSTDH